MLKLPRSGLIRYGTAVALVLTAVRVRGSWHGNLKAGGASDHLTKRLNVR